MKKVMIALVLIFSATLGANGIVIDEAEIGSEYTTCGAPLGGCGY